MPELDSNTTEALLTSHVEPWGPSVKIERPLADIIVRYGNDATPIPRLEFAPVLTVDGVENAQGTVAESCGEAFVSLGGYHGDLYHRSPIRVVLADSSTLETEYPVSISAGGSIRALNSSCQQYSVGHITRLGLTRWRWTSDQPPIAWVGLIRGIDIHHHNHNLALRSSSYLSLGSLRLQGNATWHLLRTDSYGDKCCIVVLDTKFDSDQQLLADDFTALEFLFGTPLRLELLIGVNLNNEPVAAIGTDFGYRLQPNTKPHPPVPFSRMGAANWPKSAGDRATDPTWMALAFPRLVRSIAERDLTPTSAAISAYVSSMNGYIDEQYLMAQVGLEALAYRLRNEDESRPLVSDLPRWNEFLKTLRPCLVEHAVDDDALAILISRTANWHEPSTTRLVRRVLSRMGVDVPDEGLREIRGRNPVAHELSMNRGGPYDFERDLRRVRIIQVMLAAMLLRHVGYEGMLQGWDLNEAGWSTPADWFMPSNGAREEAQVLYEARTCVAEPV